MMVVLEWLKLLLPWFAVLALVVFFFHLVSWARNRKASAFVIGAFMQMLLPDPYAERTIEVMQERKKEVIREQDENGDPPSDDER